MESNKSEQQVREYPKAMTVLCVLVSILNPLLAAAVMYQIFKARKSWSESDYRKTYRHVNNAAAVSILGIIVTGTVLVTGVSVFGALTGDNKTAKKATKSTKTIKTTTFASAFHLNSTEQIHELTVNITTSQNKPDVGHINMVGHVASWKYTSKHYINKTHVLIVDKRTNDKKILKIPSDFHEK